MNNRPFWQKKLSANILRDRLVTKTLRKQGWHVLRIWEYSMKNVAKPEHVELADSAQHRPGTHISKKM